MTEEHNIPPEQPRTETGSGIITQLQEQIEEQKQQNVHLARRIDNLSTTIGDYQKVFKLLAVQITDQMTPSEKYSEDDIVEIVQNEFDNKFTEKFSEHIADVHAEIEIDNASASLSY